MKIFFATLLCAVSLTAFSQNNQKALTKEEIDAYKARAAGISGMAQTRSPAFTENGELKRDPKSGEVVMASPGTSSMEDKGKYLNSMSGVTGYENRAEPGRGKVASASVSGSSFADFSCKLMAGSQKTVLGRVLKYQGCGYGASGDITSVSLSLCSVSLNGGACRLQDFSPDKVFRVNVYDTLDGLNIGVGCNETNKTCRITLNDSYSVAGNGAGLTVAAAQKVAASGENSAQGVTTQRYTSDTYTEKMESAAEIDACAGTAQLSAEKNGVVSTCGKDGAKKSAQVGPTATNPTCSDTPICLRRATRSVSYGQTCVRTFPLTGYSCNFTIPKLECTVIKDVTTGTVSNTCSDADLAGANKVKSTEAEPACTATNNFGACTTQTWVDYYTQPSKASLDGDCSASPFPLSGLPTEACLNQGAGTGSTCQEGGWWQRTLSDSECTVIRTDNLGDGRTTETITHLTSQEKEGCGVCVRPTSNDTCYARPTAAEPQDSCANIDVNACQLTSSTPQSQLEGMTLSQQDVYSCTKEEDTCVEYDRSNLCTNSDMTFGTDKQARSQTTTTGSMNRAMTDAALIDAVAAGTEENAADPFVPRIFGGTDSRCSKPVGFFSGYLDNDCCRLDLDRPGGSNYGNQCSLDEVKLATSRRSNFTVFIGEYCSKKSGWGPFKRCTERSQTYCSFKGLLPRIIQQQGRDQLAQLATSAASGTVQKAPLNFNFYQDNGGWAAQTTVNGVVLTPWQYPSYCANPEQAAKALTSDPNARECPLALTQWFAVCENPNGCGALPPAPELGSERWNMSTVNPLKNATTAVSRYAMVTGACDPVSTACRYEVAAWPAGIGGRAIASRELVFPLYATQEQVAKPLSGVPQDIYSMGDYIFRPNSVPGIASPSSALPATVQMDYSRNGGQTFSRFSVPTKIQGTDFSVPDSSDVRITGGCEVATNLCTFQVTGTVTVTAKPWGSPEAPECTGFTLGQVSVLDFSKMDLSEWIASIMGKAQGPAGTDLGKIAGTRAQQLLDARQNGTATVSASNPQALQAARIIPAEDFGPFYATLRVSGNFPVYFENPAENTDPVTHVDVDWGDCTVPESLAPANEYVNGLPSSGFLARHQYASPDEVPVACGGGRNSIAHKVKVRVYSKSGIHNLNLTVINTWNTFSGQGGTGGGAVNTSITVTAPKK
jgi:hypothetical protein